jgi:hypothetical protein
MPGDYLLATAQASFAVDGSFAINPIALAICLCPPFRSTKHRIRADLVISFVIYFVDNPSRTGLLLLPEPVNTR